MIYQFSIGGVVKSIVFALVFLVGGTGVAVAGDGEDALISYLKDDYAATFTKLMESDKTGNLRPQSIFGSLYRFGERVSQDHEQAMHWYIEAAEDGYMEAQYNLASMCVEGRGGPQDYAQAMYWYTKAAEAGDTGAQTALGVMYAHGKGVMQDDQRAVRWYRKAAEAGDRGAQYNLASMYYFGKGVPMDYVLAYVWATLAASGDGGNEVRKRDAIVAFMTPHQIAEAEKFIRERMPIR
ncbi:MAG: hypothetical protein CMH81_00135 [Nitrospiraceae bacterium]|nr:hypothetical protein [Nitrospiraceae bacterium]